MSTYDQIAWLPLCGGLTGLGLVLSYFVMRRRGLGAGLRWAAWSLLPLAAYLTGSIKMFWKIGVAIADFAKGFVFSTEKWAGIAVAGLAVLLFVVSGPLRRRRGKRGQPGERGERSLRAQDQQAVGAARAKSGQATAGREIAPRTAPVATTAPAQTPVKARKGKNAADDDDDLGDVEDILRRHGIT
jgi:membrane protein implicated in regulation of membrane protease activity